MNINFGNFDPVQIGRTIERVAGFDLNTLWQLSFGYKGLPFPANLLSSNIPGLSSAGRAPGKANAFSATGMPLYEKSNGRTLFMPVWIEDRLLPIARVAIGRRKLVVETPLAGKRGSVKELIRSDDYHITIQGLAFGHDKLWPEDEVAFLKSLFDLDRPVVIRSVITDMFLEGHEHVVLTDFQLPQPRSEHVQPWEIKALSDEVFDLIID